MDLLFGQLHLVVLNIHYADTVQHGKTAGQRKSQMLLPFPILDHLIILSGNTQPICHILLR
nr:MAG TPA: hypothetical protein [Caudoviricetes sp.]